MRRLTGLLLVPVMAGCALAQLYAFHGQQSVCFSCDDRDRLVVSSGQLIGALERLLAVLY